jgi:hypothetical protein
MFLLFFDITCFLKILTENKPHNSLFYYWSSCPCTLSLGAGEIY